MNDPQDARGERAAELQRLLGRPEGRVSRTRWWVAAVIALVVAAGAAWWLRARTDQASAPRYLTQPAAVGTLVVSVSATGSLQPTNKVDVGSELSGIVDQVFVDDNDRVKKGQLLARLDLAKLNDAVGRSRAVLASAEAQVLQARATLAEARANLARFRQVSELSGGKVPSRSEMDAAEAAHARAEASEAIARAAVVQAGATLRSDETNLAKAHIRSPIDGMVLTRKVEPGQTVAASFQAPVLFTIAEDLSKMELQVDVDEADVGQVRAGQEATFSVDAWPGRRYDAVITRVSFGSQVKENVVSYPTVLRVSNDDLSLRPGMTGTAEIVTLTREGVLLVPNAALRFSPPAQEAAPQKTNRSLVSMMMPRPPRQAQRAPAAGANGAPRVWVLREGQPQPVDVKTGATDGRMTEITGGALEAGTPVITEALAAPR
jgi:HlyD family secretion protein